MPTPEQVRYARKMAEINRSFGNLDHETLRRAIELLQGLRKGIGDQILAAGGFEAFRLRELQDNIGRLVNSFERQMINHTGLAFTSAIKLGGASVVGPLTAAGIQGLFFSPSQAQVFIALGFSAELIAGISGPMRGLINTQLRLAMLGQTSPFDVMKVITKILGVKAKDGIWGARNRPEIIKGVAARAEAILRTELTRMFNMAANSQQQIVAQEIPEIQKEWMATGDGRTRLSHLGAHGQRRPVDKPFDVGGSRLMHPGDPAGPAEETINCRCRTVTFHPEFSEETTPLDTQIKKEQKRRAAAA